MRVCVCSYMCVCVCDKLKHSNAYTHSVLRHASLANSGIVTNPYGILTLNRTHACIHTKTRTLGSATLTVPIVLHAMRRGVRDASTSGIYLRIYQYINTCTCVCIYIRQCVYMHTFAYAYMYISMQTRTHTYLYIHTHTHIYKFIYMQKYAYMYVYIYMCRIQGLQGRMLMSAVEAEEDTEMRVGGGAGK